MRRASMESPTEPEEEALASISQLRRTYREAAERVFDEEVEATDPAGLHKETLAMRHLEVIVMVYETMKRTQNPVLLETMADGGLRSANRIAQLLPEWKKYRVDILGMQQQIEERDRAISELTSTIEKMRMTENQVTQQLASRLVVAMENLPTTDNTPTSASKKRARPPTPSTGQSGSSSSSGSEDETEHEQDPVPLQASSPLPSVPHTPSLVDEEALPSNPITGARDYHHGGRPTCDVRPPLPSMRQAHQEPNCIQMQFVQGFLGAPDRQAQGGRIPEDRL